MKNRNEEGKGNEERKGKAEELETNNKKNKGTFKASWEGEPY